MYLQPKTSDNSPQGLGEKNQAHGLPMFVEIFVANVRPLLEEECELQIRLVIGL